MPSIRLSAVGHQTLDLAITGMTCAACSARITKTLNSRGGVSADVNLATEHATVRAPVSVAVADLIQDIEKLGFGARLSEGGDVLPADLDPNEARVRDLRNRLIVAGLLFMPLCDASLAFSLMPWMRFEGWQLLTILLAFPVVTWAAWPMLSSAVRAAAHLSFTMDTLVAIGIVTSTAWSLYAMFELIPGQKQQVGLAVLIHPTSGALYLDVAAGVTTFVLAGRYYEALTRQRAGNVLRKLASSGARAAVVLTDEGTETEIPVDRLLVGDRAIVRCGAKIPADGEVVAGEALVNRSLVTGESTPVATGVGDQVIGGTIAIDGHLVVEVKTVGSQTQLAQMIALVGRAQNEKAAFQRLADRIAGVFVPVVIGIALSTLLVWLTTGSSVERAMSAALAVLIIACPCALGLATPMALMVASTRGSERGIFIKGYQALERTEQIDTVILDKTGTVTKGTLEVTDVRAVEGVSPSEVLKLAGAAERLSEHAIGRAVVAAAGRVSPVVEAAQFRTFIGRGVEAEVDGREVLVGSEAFMDEHNVRFPGGDSAHMESQGARAGTIVRVAADGSPLGTLMLSDALKPSAGPALRRLHDQGLTCILMTGDSRSTAEDVARAVGVDSVVAEVLPQEKVRHIRELQASGRRVAFVGDGVNDAPAIATADLGLALGSGTDVAIDAADIVLVRDDLTTLPVAIDLARRTLRTIHGNLVWAFCYNVAALPLAAVGLLNPLLAGACMAISSAFVVWNSSRLGRVTSQRLPENRQAAGGNVRSDEDSESSTYVEGQVGVQIPA